MASMHSFGIAPSEALILMEYPEIGWFLSDITRQKSNEDLKSYLKIAEAVRVGTSAVQGKKGHKAYVQWRHKLENEIQESTIDLEKVTVFEKLKEHNKNRIFTVFEKLKRRK